MSTIRWAFAEVGPAAGLLLPVLLLAAGIIGDFVLRVAPSLARLLAAAAVAASLVLVLVLTMRPAAAGLGVRVEPLLDPTVSLDALLQPSPGRRMLRLEALGNLLLLMPLGAALRFLTGWRSAALLVGAVAVSVEAAQWALATGRVPDALDLVLNTAGGLLGVAIASLAVRLVGAAAGGSGGGDGRRDGNVTGRGGGDGRREGDGAGRCDGGPPLPRSVPA